jgi:hypothetical protein
VFVCECVCVACVCVCVCVCMRVDKQEGGWVEGSDRARVSVTERGGERERPAALPPAMMTKPIEIPKYWLPLAQQAVLNTVKTSMNV